MPVQECREAKPEDSVALKRMLELYQHDISDMYDQDLDANGEYGYDLTRFIESTSCFAYVALVDNRYAGFALVAPAFVTKKAGYWIEQFFVLKKYRREKLSAALAYHVFQSHLGEWEVGQVPSNLPAQFFWRKVISKITDGHFIESRITEGRWKGVVQSFSNSTAA